MPVCDPLKNSHTQGPQQTLELPTILRYELTLSASPP